MRAFEILLEGYSTQLMSDLQDLLASAKGHSQSEVFTSDLVSQLVSMGHNVNTNSIMTILTDNPFVQSATPDTVFIQQDDESEVGIDNGVDNEEQVSQMAQQTADSDIQSDDLV